MHLLVREQRSLDAEAAADDLGQSPADLVLLSFSDADLGAACAAWEALEAGNRPSLRLANLRRLRHPMSVDLYLEQVIGRARCVVVRLLGGLEYFRYGVDEIATLCRAEGIALALLPGDGRDDDELRARSTIGAADWAVLCSCLDQGGPENLRRALLLAAHLAGLADRPTLPALPLPAAGEYALNSPLPLAGEGWVRVGSQAESVSLWDQPPSSRPSPASARRGAKASEPWASAAIVFYRSHLQSGDIAPVEALMSALAVRGIGVRALYVSSLKDAEAADYVAERLREWRPQVVLNTTAFSARRGDASPLEASGAPVLQAVLAGSSRETWAQSLRGLSGTDLAMHVVLPELDGRLLTTAISFKQEASWVPGLEYARTLHAPDADGIALAAERAVGWARLATTPPGSRVIACVLSDYPGGGRVGHAVGLDTYASLSAILGDLVDAGYTTEALGAGTLVAGLCDALPITLLDLPAYRALFADLPEPAREAIVAAWGEAAPGDLEIRLLRAGNMIVAVQPDRGSPLDRKAGYHDPDCAPRHGFVAFYLWLRHVAGAHAILHLGAHGTLEWLPGKSVALSRSCFPAALTGGLPVIYPFIVNNPGEAAAAKRRLGAVTIGHLTPPLLASGSHGEAGALERLLEEYAEADGMDRRRIALLRREILDRAAAAGLLAESGAGDLPEDDRLARLDTYLCDVKDAQIRDGLHIFGRDAPGERAGLLAALDGRFVPPGPAGAPSRGRADVLPTGRNLTTTDPRVIPTPTAMTLAAHTAAELLRRHLQDHGDYPRALVLNLWGSTTMRTGGEDLALALTLLGVRPEWDAQSGRVTGFEVLPIALLDRPRIDVTLRISGLFRDAFPQQIELFDAAVRAVAARDEAADWNPLAGIAGARIFGPAAGTYGTGVGTMLDAGAWTGRAELGAAYLAGSAAAYGRDDAGDFEALVRAADAYVQIQDHRETDLLEGSEYAAHEGGFAALADHLGTAPALYHADTGVPDAPRIRTVGEEVARITRARAANPAWIAGMRRHGYRGAAEIARGLDGLYAFAACVPDRFDRQFDLLWAATLGDEAVDAFLADANAAARDGMASRFADARRRGLWQTRRNDVAARLEAVS